MRLRQRSTVVLPQPDGPMNAVISWRRDLEVDVARPRGDAAVAGPRGSASSKTSSRGFSAGSSARRPRDVRRYRSLDVGRPCQHLVDDSGGGLLSLMTTPMSRRSLAVSRRVLTRRATAVKMKTIRISVSAAPQARSRAAGNGCVALRKICAESVVFEPLNGFQFVVDGDADREQQRRGLARGARDGEQRAAHDAGRRARGARRVRSCGALRLPSAKLPSRRSSGTSLQHLVGRADDDRQHEARRARARRRSRSAS